MPYVDLKRLRYENGEMKQSELAEKLGCEQSHISQMESGKRSITDEMYARITAEFGDITRYITDVPSVAVVQQNQNGDNIGGDKNFFTPEDKDAEILRLNTLLEAAKNEISWLRGMVERLSSR